MIGINAFSNSSIENLTIPLNLIELKEGWCTDTKKLTKVIISPNHPRYFNLDNKLIIGKKRLEQTNYDPLVFCCRDVKMVTIPSFIEYICSSAFDKCIDLQQIKISIKESKLRKIGDQSFFETSLKKIKIPSKVREIGENCFAWCQQLQRVEIENDSNLQTIGNCSFCETSINNFTITPKVTRIGANAFNNCLHLQKIIVENHSDLQTIDMWAFSESSINSISIPSQLRIIGKGAFSMCFQLKIIEIGDELSKIELVDKNIFEWCNNLVLMIPSSLRNKFNF